MRTYVSDNGAVMLTDTIVADGHVSGLLARVVTHVHSDHIAQLRRSIREAAFLLATPLTHDLLSAMGYTVPFSKRVEASYHTRLRIEDYVVELHPANHVPGAAQVTVELPGGERVGYTGDFKLPGTEILRDLDVLVIDATYGFEEWQRPWQEEVEYLLADIVNDELSRGGVAIYGYNGKQEEVMLLLRRMGVSAPFIVPRRRIRVIEVLRRHGFELGEVLVEGSAEAFEARRSGWFVEFRHYNEWKRRRRGNGSVRMAHVLLTGWEFRAPYRSVGSREWVVSFSDHADFRQLVEYVSEARPRLLVVDAARGGAAAAFFARYASEKLGVRAVAQPLGV